MPEIPTREYLLFISIGPFSLYSLSCVSVVTEYECGLGVRFAEGYIICYVTTELLVLLRSELHVSRAVTDFL